MSSQQEKRRQCQLAAAALAGITMRFDATCKLYDSAVFLRQGQEADKFRMELHELLDQRLDHTGRLMQLTREMIELPPGD